MRFRCKRTNGAINIYGRNISFPLPAESQQSDVSAHLRSETRISIQKLFITKRRTTFAVRKNRIERDLFVFFFVVDTRFSTFAAPPQTMRHRFLLFANRVSKLWRPPKDAEGVLPSPSFLSPCIPSSFSLRAFFFLLCAQDLEVDVRSLVRERH